MAVHHYVVIPADGFAAVFETPTDVSQLLSGEQAIREVACLVGGRMGVREAELESGPAGRGRLHSSRPVFATGGVEQVARTFIVVHAHAVAEPAAQQRGDGQVEELAGNVPQSSLNSAHGPQQNMGGAIGAISLAGI